MADSRTGVDFSECAQCLSMTFLVEGEVPLNRFLHDPASGPFEAFCEAIEPTGQLVWNVRGHDPVAHGLIILNQGDSEYSVRNNGLLKYSGLMRTATHAKELPRKPAENYPLRSSEKGGLSVTLVGGNLAGNSHRGRKRSFESISYSRVRVLSRAYFSDGKKSILHVI